MRCSVITLFITLLVACSSNSHVPGNVIEPKKMQRIIFDLLRADEFINTYTIRDSALDKKKETIRMYEQVFLIHQTTKDAFYKSYQFYQKHPDINKVMFDSLYNWASKRKNVESPILPVKKPQ